MSPAALGTFLDVLPAPMTLGPVNLADGRTVVGFGCNRSMVDGCRDITEFGGWLGYLSAEARSGAVSH
ncbi:Urea amidolyase, allophanate hydrolase subunit [Mycobacteroides abscessus subsp. abscessus]|nr:Urea amidolyase, allophanate hydrolase subunit [Mycobacteroides abscessus subsp. abscessus]